MDFGIARLANPPKGKGLTEAGMSVGTPDYMSPEQLSGPSSISGAISMRRRGVVRVCTGKVRSRRDDVGAGSRASRGAAARPRATESGGAGPAGGRDSQAMASSRRTGFATAAKCTTRWRDWLTLELDQNYESTPTPSKDEQTSDNREDDVHRGSIPDEPNHRTRRIVSYSHHANPLPQAEDRPPGRGR